MENWSNDVHFYIFALVAHWSALLTGGIVMAGVGIFEHQTQKNVSWKVYAFVIAAFGLYATFQAWQDEHRNTQNVISEKAALSAEVNSCAQNVRDQEAYKRGLEFASLKREGVIDEQHNIVATQQNLLTGQQSNLNACMEKMTPKIAVRYKISTFLVADNKAFNDYLFGMVMTVNQPAAADGNIKCENPFTPLSSPHADAAPGTSALLIPNQAVQVGDREISVRATSLGREWNSTSPVTIVVKSSLNDLGKCEFTPL